MNINTPLQVTYSNMACSASIINLAIFSLKINKLATIYTPIVLNIILTKP